MPSSIKTKLFAVLSVIICLASACGKRLDLLPQQNITSEIALGTDANVKRALRGAYDILSDGYLLGGDIMLFSELLASNEEIKWEGSYNQPREVFTKQILVTNSYVSELWLRSFRLINLLNNVLSSISAVNETDKDRVKGEALLLRAIIYFELVQLYAPAYNQETSNITLGMPIMVSPTSTDNISQKISRQTQAETYSQIINDASDAYELLPVSNSIFLNKVAAAGYISRMYLQINNYEKALEYANLGIKLAADNQYSLTQTYHQAFNNSINSREDLFAIQISDQDGENNMQLFWSVPEYGGRDGDVSIQQKHIGLYEPGDARLDLFYIGNGALRSGKWKLKFKNIPLLRLAELYLTRAECNLRLRLTVGSSPANDLNLIRKRVGLHPNLQPSIDDILLERKLELAHEGRAIHDAKRLKQKIDQFEYNSSKLVLPIPQREIETSSGLLEQNSGY